MIRHSGWLMIATLVACAAAPAPQRANGPAHHAPCPAAPAPANAPKVVSLEPDPPTAEDAAKARAILALPPPITEVAPRFSPDGQHVAYVSNAEGLPALYLGDLKTKDTRKVALLQQRFRRPVFARDGASLYFTSDDHGDEAYTLFRVALSSGAIEAVTPGEKLRREGPWLTKTGDRMFFTARKMLERGVILYEQAATAGATPARVYANETLEMSALRSDGKQVLLVEASNARELHVLDLPATAAPRRLYPLTAERTVTIHDVAYSPDGTRAYVATDDGGDKGQLLALDVRTGRVLARYTEARFPASKLQGLVAAGDRVSAIVDAGTSHAVRILDAAKLTPITTQPDLPVGSEVPGAHHPNMTGGLALSEDGKRVAVQWSTPSSPARVFVVDTSTGARAPLTKTAAASGDAIEATVATIPSWDGLALPALVYLPPGAGAKRLPVVVSIHGGFPFASTARYDAQIALLVREGYAVVEPNIRGSGGFGRAYELADDGVKKLDAVRDLGVVARWVAAQAWADPKRLALTGRSAGGYYALFGLEHDPELWRAGIAVVPMYDAEASVRTTDGDLRAFMEQKELVPLSDPMVLAALSPSTYVGRLRAPLFVFAASRDVRTPIVQTESLVRELRERGRPLEYMRVDGGHNLDDPRTRAELWARMLRFLKTNLAP